MSLKRQAAALLVTMFGLPAVGTTDGAAAVANVPAYSPFYVDENSANYNAQVTELSTTYAKRLAANGMTDPNAPMQCFGENFEMYEQL